MFTVDDIGRIFKCGKTQAYKLVNTSGFPIIKIGGKILTEKNALESWIKKSLGKSIIID